MNKDIMVVTCDAKLLHTFLNYPLMNDYSPFDGCRIWVVVDDRVQVENRWNSKHKVRRQKLFSSIEEIQFEIDYARDVGISVFPHAISGKSIIQHYQKKWRLKGVCESFLKYDTFSVKVLGVSALRELYGLESVMSVDDDTIFFKPPDSLFVHKFAIAHTPGKSVTAITDTLKNRDDFYRISSHTGYDGSFDQYCFVKPCGGVIRLSDLDQYTELWESIFSDEHLSMSQSNPVNLIDQVAVAQWIMSRSEPTYVFTSDPYGEVYTSFPKVKDGMTSCRKRMNPIVWHYACGGWDKHTIVEWVREAEVSADSRYWENIFHTG